MPTQVAEIVAERARRLGPIPFDEVMDIALYDPQHGFYSTGAGAGRSGDFLTSPEVGPLFGKLIADALDRWWLELGEPDPYVVVEAGAGAGTLARDVLAAGPGCAPALRYVLIERSEVLRERQSGRLPLEPARQVLGPIVHGADPEEGPHTVQGIGPMATTLGEMPSGPFTGVVLANELLDNLPFGLLERRGGWAEVRVGAQLGEVLVPTAPELARHAESLAPEAPEGARIPLQSRAGEWLRSALTGLERGVVVAIDYADTTPSMANRPWTEWVRTYRGHGPGGHPLENLGEQDVTCEVAVDQLNAVHPRSSDLSQAEFLFELNMASIVAEAREAWHERAHIGDLEALEHRSRLTEADALTDPSGLGAFRVLEWKVDG